MQVTPNCLWRVSDITRIGLKKLGYESFEEMWADYNVLALVRNPYDRAGSSYDYTLGRRTVRPPIALTWYHVYIMLYFSAPLVPWK